MKGIRELSVRFVRTESIVLWNGTQAGHFWQQKLVAN